MQVRSKSTLDFDSDDNSTIEGQIDCLEIAVNYCCSVR